MSEKDYVNRTLTFLEKVMTALFAVLCAFISFFVSSCLSENQSLLLQIFMIASGIFSLCDVVCLIFFLVLYRKNLRSLRTLK